MRRKRPNSGLSAAIRFKTATAAASHGCVEDERQEQQADREGLCDPDGGMIDLTKLHVENLLRTGKLAFEDACGKSTGKLTLEQACGKGDWELTQNGGRLVEARTLPPFYSWIQRKKTRLASALAPYRSTD